MEEPQRYPRPNVRVGSLGDIAADRHDLRFTLKSRHHWAHQGRQLCANKRHATVGPETALLSTRALAVEAPAMSLPNDRYELLTHRPMPDR